jgi:hypothetical protein
MHFSMMGSPLDKETVYVGGDTQLGPFPNFIGAVQYSARLFRGNASVESDMLDDDEIVSPQWEHMTDWNNVTEIPGGGTASGSAPHADSRDFAFRADGNLLNANDGGVAVLTNPSSNDGDWYGICGSMQNFEAHRYVVLGSMVNSVMHSFLSFTQNARHKCEFVCHVRTQCCIRALFWQYSLWAARQWKRD